MKRLFLILFVFIATNAMAQEIFNAITGNDIEKVKNLIESDTSLLESKQEHNMTPLMFAASEGNYELTKLLINKGANIHYTRPLGFSTIFMPSMFGHFEIVKLLVEHGVDINIKDRWGRTALYVAINFGTKEIAEYLVDQGAEIPVKDDLLHHALAKGMTEIVEFMLKNGANTNSINENDGTLLHSAAKGNQANIVKEMIDKGMNINMKNRYGLAPIHFASMYGNREYIEMLIKHNADINLKTNTGKNAYMLAYENNHQELAEILKNAGAKDIILEYMDVPDEPYFGLKKPDLISEIFAPGIITTEIGEHGPIAISPKMDEIYWQSQGIKFTKKVNGKWTFPDTLAVFQRYQANNPVISYDGNTLFFQSKMSLKKDGTFKDNDLWMVRRIENRWSEPENLGPNVNSNLNEIRASVARNGNIYFSVGNDFYRSIYKNGQYQPREKLGSPLDDKPGNAQYIAADESFIIFESNKEGGFSNFNLYICFKKEDGSWSEPIIMGKDICKGNARFPGMISPDGNYFFYLLDLDYYWVSAKIIEELKPKDLK